MSILATIVAASSLTATLLGATAVLAAELTAGRRRPALRPVTVPARRPRR